MIVMCFLSAFLFVLTASFGDSLFLPGSAYKGIRQLQSRSSHPLFSLQTNVFHDLANSKCLFDLLYSQLKLSAQITGYQYGEICLYTHDSAAVHGMRANANPTLQLACSYVQEDVHGHDNYFARQANGNVHPEVITMPLAIEHREYGLLKLMKPYALSSTSNTPNAADINATLELCCESISRVLDMELRHPVLEQQLHFTLKREAFVHGSVISCLQNLRTLTRLIGKRLKKEDTLGQEILENIVVQADEIDQANSLLSPTTQSHTTPSTSMSVGGIMDCQVDYTDVTARSSDIPFGSSVYRTGTRTSASGSPMDLVSMTSRSASIVHRGHDGDVMLMDNMRVNPENIMEMEDLWRMSKEETEIHIHHSSDDRVGEDKGEEKSKRSKKN